MDGSHDRAPALPAGGPVGAAAMVLDARAEPRVAAGFCLQLFSSDFAGGLRACTRDLSIGGACVATLGPIALGSIRHVRLDLPSGPIELPAEGRWQGVTTSEEVVLTGVAFRRIDTSARERLWNEVRAETEKVARFLHFESELSELGSDDALSLAGHSRLRSSPPGRLVYRQDTRSPGDDSIFALLAGRVRLYHKLSPAAEVGTPELRVGTVFGGLPALAGLEHSESAIAVDRVELLEISQASYSYLRVGNPLLAQRLAKIVMRSCARRMRHFLEVAGSRS